MKITIQTLKNVKYPIDVTEQQTVLAVKQAINAVHQLGEADEQKLIHKGKILKDDQTVGDAGIKDQDSIVIMVSKKKAATTTVPAAQPSQSAQPAQPTTQSATPAVQPAAASTSASTQPAAAQATPSTSTPANVSSAASSNLVVGEAEEAVITDLMSMGFERDLVVRALRAAFNNPDRAADYLFSGNIPASAEVPAQTQAASPASIGAAPATTGAAPAQTQQSAAPVGGDMAAGLAGLLQSEQGQQIREMIQQNPELLPAILQRMQESDPQLFQALAANPQFLQQFLSGQGQAANDPAAMLTALAAMSRGAGGQAAGGVPPGATRIQVTPEERAQLEQLESLGFSRHRVLEAWLACDRNMELAASYLFNSADDDQDFGGAQGGTGGAQ